MVKLSRTTSSGSDWGAPDAEEEEVDGKEFLFMKVREAGSSDLSGFLDAGAAEADATDATGATQLGADAVQQLFNRVGGGSWQGAPADTEVEEFKVRQASLQIPDAGLQLEHAFPPKDEASAAPAADDGAPLTVLRSTPSEAVRGVVPFIHLTFSHPMVALGTVADVQAGGANPLALSPSIPGRYRWLGTQTLIFEPEHRIPQSTRVTYTIAKGTKDASGSRSLAQEYVTSFETPTLRVESRYPRPRDVTHARPLLLAVFDQRVDAKALLASFQLRAGSTSAGTLRVLTKEQVAEVIASDSYYERNGTEKTKIQRLLSRSPEDCCVWLQPALDLAKDTTYALTLVKGAPSAEGPLLTPEDISVTTFSTFQQLAVEHPPEEPSPDDSGLLPLAPFAITFNNFILKSTVDVSCITVNPPIRNMKITAQSGFMPFGAIGGDTEADLVKNIEISGVTQGDTTYEVTIQEGFAEDVFGQRLAKPAKLRLRVGPAAQSFDPLIRADDYVIDPTGYGCAKTAPARQLSQGISFSIGQETGQFDASFVTTNVGILRFTVYQVEPKNRAAFIESQWRWGRDQQNQKESLLARLRRLATQEKFKQVADGFVSYEFQKDCPTQVNFDLRPFLQHGEEGCGQLVVGCSPVLERKQATAPSTSDSGFRVHPNFPGHVFQRFVGSALQQLHVGRTVQHICDVTHRMIGDRDTVWRSTTGDIDVLDDAMPEMRTHSAFPQHTFVRVSGAELPNHICDVSNRPIMPDSVVWRSTTGDVDILDDVMPRDGTSAPDAGAATVVRKGEWIDRGQWVMPQRGGSPRREYGDESQLPCQVSWVQATSLAVCAVRHDGPKQSFLWVTDLRDGVPKKDVEISGWKHADDPRRRPRQATSTQAAMAVMNLGRSDTNGVVMLEDDLELDTLVAQSGADMYVSGLRRHHGMRRDPHFLCQSFTDRGLYRPKETVLAKGILRKQVWTNDALTSLETPEPRTLQWSARDGRGVEFAKGDLTTSDTGSWSLSIDIPDNVNTGDCMLTVMAKAAMVPGDGRIRDTVRFSVQEFRKPEYEVTCNPPAEQQIVGSAEAAVLKVNASYYAGGGITNADVQWTISQASGNYAPPPPPQDSTMWDGYSWQEFRPYFWRSGLESSSQGATYRHRGVTSSTGEHSVAIEHKPNNTRVPVNVHCECEVTDPATRQARHSVMQFVVHPCELYVGMKCDRCTASPQQDFKVHLCVADIAGNPMPKTKVTLLVKRQCSEVRGLDKVAVEKEVEVVEEMTGPDGKASHILRFAAGGEHTLIASVSDAEGRSNQSSRRLFVAGGQSALAGRDSSSIPHLEVEVLPDTEEYKPGDVAQVTVCTPFACETTYGWVVFAAGGLLKQEQVKISGPYGSTVVSFPIGAEHVPNLVCKAWLAGCDSMADPAADPSHRVPASAEGQVELHISNLCKTLTVDVKPREAVLRPGGETILSVDVKGSADGKPAGGAEVTLWAVDEAVLSIAGYSLPSPVAIFYPARQTSVHGFPQELTRNQVCLRHWGGINLQPPQDDGDEPEMATAGFGACRARGMMMGGAMPMMACAMDACCERACCSRNGCAPAPPGGGAEAEPQTIAVRTNFSSLAVWKADLRTDAAGHVEHPVKLPDNLTRYRVFAYCHSKENQVFGKGESQIDVRQPMSLRLSMPRFLRFGDRCAYSVVVQNLSADEAVVHLASRMANLEATGASGFEVAVRPGQRREVRFEVEARNAGTAKCQVVGAIVRGAAGAAGFGDAEEREIPVWTPATSESFATYGEVDGESTAVTQLLKPPADVWPQFGGLQVSLSSTILQSLTDSVVYILDYSFACVEQRASRVIALLTARATTQAFGGLEGIPDEKQLSEQIEDTVTGLLALQRSDGAFGWWRSDSQPSPFLTLHVALALAVLLEKEPAWLQKSSFADKRGRLLHWIENMDSFLQRERYSAGCILQVKAFAAQMLTRHSQLEKNTDQSSRLLKAAAALLKSCWESKDSLSLESLAWLAMAAKVLGNAAVVKEAMNIFRTRTVETAETAHFTVSESDSSQDKLVLLRSDRRTDGIILEALLRCDPANTLISKVVKGLLRARKRGRWANTQECCYILLSLDLYFQVAERETPQFTSAVWVGSGCVLEESFQGRQASTSSTKVPMNVLCSAAAEGFAVLGPEPDRKIVIGKQGKGKLYYRLALNYAPRSLKLEACDEGFAVTREYFAIGDAGSVVPLASEDGPGYKVKLGACIRVKVSMSLKQRRYHVALVDMLPAGFEAVNPELQGGAGMTMELQRALSPQPPGGSRPTPLASCWMWNPRWYEHDSLRDERVEAFGTLVWEGVHSYTYIARATAVGDFQAPPAKVEEMYSPEVFGRSASMRVVVVA